MLDIVPAILAKSLPNFIEQVQKIEGLVRRVHVDIMDGIFVPQKTISPSDLLATKTSLKFVLHLMVSNDAHYISELLRLKNTETIILHVENKTKLHSLIESIKSAKKKVGLALCPQTPLSEIKQYLADVDEILFMTVPPGLSGQKFMREPLVKIRQIQNEGLLISVDGGINENTIMHAYSAGARRFYVSSALFSAPDLRVAFDKLRMQGD